MSGWGWFWLFVGVWVVYKVFKKSDAEDQDFSDRDFEPSYSPPRRKRKSDVPVRWLPKGHSIEISGITIPGGMIYTGGTGEDWYGPKSVIDPSLPVASSRADYQGRYMNYWPSYSSISATSRLAYLEWLAGGRSDPDTDIGYVFLFFYGLEYRLLKEQAMDDAHGIVAEVKRLQSIYGDNSSFRVYSRNFLDAVDLLHKPVIEDAPPPPSIEAYYDIPPRLLICLGYHIAENEPLNADWMLAWMLAHPETRLRVPAKRAFDEFCTLFRKRFDEKYPEGLKVKPPARKIGAISYRVASGDFLAELEGEFSAWPSVANITAPVHKAQDIAEQCMKELDAYSRFVGKNPEAKGSLQAKLLLPSELLANAGGEVSDVLSWLQSTTTATAQDFLDRLGISTKDGKLRKAQASQIADIASRFGYAVEPDVRLGARTPKIEDSFVLFKLPEDEDNVAELSQDYWAASLTLSLCALVAHADDVITPEEEAHMLALAESNLHLSKRERLRLEAHARWLLINPPSLRTVQSRLSDVPERERQTLAQFTIALAASDNHVAVEEIKLLERIYKLLGLEKDRLFSDIHAMEASTSDEPVVVRPSKEDRSGRLIPQPIEQEELEAESIVLDMARIQEIRKDTAHVSSLLSEIFIDETQPADVDVDEDIDEEGGSYDGLDRRHEALLKELIVQPSWPRTDFEQLCRSMNLLPGGTLENLNEWAFENFDDAILDDGDPVNVNVSVLEGAV